MCVIFGNQLGIISIIIMKITFLVFVLYAALANVLAATEEYAPTVSLKAGQIRGLVKTVEKGKVYTYEGIRYGQATRFSAPKPTDHWAGVYNATRFRFACPQADFKLSSTLATNPGTTLANEDCLYLSVWRPTEEKANRTVMVWIHGGGFNGGTIFNQMFDGRYMSHTGDVVVVTIQYRLGALGFLYGDTSDAPGNLGLRDQILALKWVQENIEHFSGDPKKVTIFGESAGSMSVGALILSPLSENLFHRAIMQSGAPNSYMGSEPKKSSLNKTLNLATTLNCSLDSHETVLHCLRGKPVQEILDSTNNAILNGESFIPIYGEEVLPMNPVKELKTAKFNKKVDILFGVTSGEGSGFVAPNLPMINSDSITVEMANKIISLMYQMFQVPYYKEVADFYTQNLSNTNKDDLRRAVVNSFSDYHIVCPEMFFAEQFSKDTPTGHFYSYRLTQQIKNGCRGWQETCHGEDNSLVWGHPVTEPRRFSADDNKLSIAMVRAWTDFAKTGNPGKMGTVEWKSAFEGSSDLRLVQFMSLHAEQYKMVMGFYKRVCDDFWKPKLFA